jgi:hypothetical protein
MLWPIADDAPARIDEAVRFVLKAQEQPRRRRWHVAEAGGRLVGVIHSMTVPVPPIYAGRWGEPGLLMPECFVIPDAPSGTIEVLVEAAEADLRADGAELLIASFVVGDEWRSCFEGRGYQPVTLYLGKAGFEDAAWANAVRAASEADLEGIVRRSAEHRSVLSALDTFWTIHADADALFGAWMKRSLTLQDRDMLVAASPHGLDGYAIAQPASRLHFPPAHAIAATGVIDDYFHTDFADPAALRNGGTGAAALLAAAEAAFHRRGVRAAIAVCPAAWISKITVLEKAGYRMALVWMVKR